MNKRYIKKVISAVLAAALIFSTNGITPTNASAAEKIYVEGVYTNVQKATLVTGATKQITTYTEPENATNQEMRFASSDTQVATVTKTGLVKAVAPGTAIITVTARDGSNEKETVKITVLQNITITKKNVDVDNEVIVMDKTYGHVTIDKSVGDANIYLSGVAVKGTLTLQSGADYTLSMYDSKAKEVIIDEPMTDNIQSFAVSEEDDESLPTLNVGENTEISDIHARVSAMIRQEDGSEINGLSFEQDSEGKITVYLEGYSGSLAIDASLGDLEIRTTGCEIEDVVVNGGETPGLVSLTDSGESTIGNLTMNGSANVNLGIPTQEVKISESATGTSLVATGTIGTINNLGTGSSFTVAGTVDNFVSNGTNANINVGQGAAVTTINLNGAGSSLSGKGEVAEAYINANDCKVDTENTLVTVGDVSGTKVQGKVVAGNSSETTVVIPVGGAVGDDDEESDEIEIVEGLEIVNNNFEDGKYNLEATMGSGTVRMSVVDGGNGGGKALLVSNRGADYHGVGFNFFNYLDQHVIVRIKFDIKPTANGSIKATMKSNLGYTQVDKNDEAVADTWYPLEGTFELGNDVTDAYLYIEAPTTTDYYLDNVLITVDSIGEAIPVADVSIDYEGESLVLDKGETQLLTATVSPDDADNKAYTWSSSNSNVVIISDAGLVTAKNAGSAVITVTTADGNKTDTLSVTVTDNIALTLDRKEFTLTQVGQNVTLTPSIAEGISWSSSDTNVATIVDGVVTSGADGTAIITATVGEKSTTCKVIVNSKAVLVEDFEDNNNSLSQDYATLSVVSDQAYDGDYSLKAVVQDPFNGPKVTLNNSLGTNAAVFKISAYVKNGSTGTINVKLTNPSPWSDHGNVTAGSTWVLLESGDITVPAGATYNVRIRNSSGTDGVDATYYVDNVVVTKVSGGDIGSGGTMVPYFTDYYLTENTNITTPSTTFYLDGNNLRDIADDTISDTNLLDKFTSWSGIMEVAKGLEYTVTLNTASATSGKTLKTNILIQNKTSDGWNENGSYKNFSYDTLVASTGGTPITVTRTILFDEVTWNADDTTAGKIELTLPDVAADPAVVGTLSIKVLSREYEVVPTHFDSFNAVTDRVFELSGATTNWDNVYINGSNLRDIANNEGVTDEAVLTKFTTWNGVKEVVKAFKVTVTVTSGSAIGGNLLAEVVMQNQTAGDGWSESSYKSFSLDSAVTTVSGSAITLTKTITLSEETWLPVDATLGKIALRFNNVDPAIAVKGKWTIEVIPNQK